MTQVALGIAALVNKGYSDDKCPFCGGAEHEFPSKKDRETTKVVSKPEQLACSMSGGANDRRGNDQCGSGQYAYTLARHHLISAKQCYAKLSPLVRMGSLVGYDVNDPKNGIGLPTTHYTLKYPKTGGRKYGDLGEADKETVAFAIMKELKAQWHVGHHSFAYQIPFENQDSGSAAKEDWGDEVDNKEPVGHETGYDVQIISKLIDLMLLLFNNKQPICKEQDVSNDVKQKFIEVSDDIRTDLEKFQTDPSQSKLYVSQKAYDYANSGDRAAKRTISEISGGDEPDPPSTSRPKKKQRR